MILSKGMMLLITGTVGIVMSLIFMLILHKRFKKSEKILLSEIENES